MGKAKDIKDAAKEYKADQVRMWRETPGRSTQSLRKLEGTDKKSRKKG